MKVLPEEYSGPPEGARAVPSGDRAASRAAEKQRLRGTQAVTRERCEDDLRALGRLLLGLQPNVGLDWAALVELARRHGVSPLLFWRLENEGADLTKERAVPAAVRERLQTDFYSAAARGAVAEYQSAKVLRALTAAEVTTMVVKGAAVGSFYPNPALRFYSDLDLMVPWTQLDEAERVLRGLGYWYSEAKDWWLDHFYHLPLMINDDGLLAVELHWRLDADEAFGRLPVDELWDRSVPWSLQGQPVLRLEAVDTVLHLCRHAVVQHRAQLGLRPVCDLAQVVKGWERVEWEALKQRAARYGLARPVYLMLTLAEQMLGLDMPAGIVSGLRPPGTTELPTAVVEHLVRLEGGPATRVPGAVVQAGAKRTLGARLSHFLWHLFLPRDGMAVVYNIPADSPLIWLTYLWRPLDLLRRYGRFVWGLLSGEQAAQRTWAREVWLERWLRAEGENGGGSDMGGGL